MGSCAAPSAKGDDKFITTDYLQQCQIARQLHVIGFCNIATIIQFLLSGQKIDGHTGLPA
ncbi:replication initiator protein [Salmonella enterica subsp. enterica serovar Senftenberg]|nr:replication initiator protein [Salmonella enterica subsp. enterica serovar Senftenberg]ECN4929734.1 replication initiator protein [Salmonella enterica subsp. enterica serovar Senftenberg]